MTTNKTYTTLLLIAIILLTGCKTIKKVGDTSPKQTKSKTISAVKMVKKIQQQQPAFHRAYVKKMSIGIDLRGREMDVKATCKIVTDSAIHVSIQPFMGIELFKIEMTPKKLLIIDKTNKTFYESNYGILYETTGIGIDYDEIQAIITNRLFVPDKRTIRPNEFEWAKEDNKRTLLHSQKETQQNITIDQETERITQMQIKQTQRDLTMRIDYTDFKQLDKALLFPTNIVLNTQGKNSTAQLKFHIEKVEIEKPFTIKPAKLIRYKRGSIKALLDK